MNVAEIIARELKKNSIKDIFMLTGYGAMYLNDAIQQAGINYYAARNETAEKFKNIDVINLFKLKNFDKKNFIKSLKNYKKIFIFDENSKSGGISSIILNILNANKVKKNPIILSSKDEQSFFYSQDRELNIKNSKISKNDLLRIIKSL